MSVIQVILLNGTTADANDVMADFNEIYTNIDNTNIAAGAGIVFSKLDAATVAGVTATQTLTNKTLTSPVINNPTISGLTLSGAITLSSAHFTGDFNLWSGSDISLYSDSGGTRTFNIDGANGNTSLVSTAILSLSGIGGGTKITETSPGHLDFYSGGINGMTLLTTALQVGLDLTLSVNKKLYFDGGTNTYLSDDGSSIIDVFTGGTNCFTFGASTVQCGVNFSLTTNRQLLLDGPSGNDYITNTANGQNDIIAAGTLALRTGTGGTVSFPNGVLATTFLSTVLITGTLTVSATQAILPAVTQTQNIGSASKAFANYYVNNQIIWDTNTAKNIDFATAGQIGFNNADISVLDGNRIILNGILGDYFFVKSGTGVNLDMSGTICFGVNPTGSVTDTNIFVRSNAVAGGTSLLYQVHVGSVNTGPGGSGRALFINN